MLGSIAHLILGALFGFASLIMAFAALRVGFQMKTPRAVRRAWRRLALAVAAAFAAVLSLIGPSALDGIYWEELNAAAWWTIAAIVLCVIALAAVVYGVSKLIRSGTPHKADAQFSGAITWLLCGVVLVGAAALVSAP